MSEALLTVDQAAKQLTISRATAYKMVDTGEILTIKIGRLRRVPQSSIDQFIAGKISAAALEY